MHWQGTLLFQHHEGPDNSRLCQLLPPLYTAICHLFSQLISSVSLHFFLLSPARSVCDIVLSLSSLAKFCHFRLSTRVVCFCLSICLRNTLYYHALRFLLSFFSQFLLLTFALFSSDSFSLFLSPWTTLGSLLKQDSVPPPS